MVVEDDQAAGGGLQLLDQSTVTGARWVDVQGCCGVHGVASLCGGRVRQISTCGCYLSIFINFCLGFRSGEGRVGVVVLN